MEIKVPKEIRQYEESLVLGLSVRQCVFGVLAIGMAAAVFFLLRGVLPLDTVGWVSILAAAPFAFAGFFRYHGMNAEQTLLAWYRSEVRYPKRLLYRPSNLYYDCMTPAIDAGIRAGRRYKTKRHKAKSRKTKYKKEKQKNENA